MTNQERIEEYIKEHCKRCKNRNTDSCEIKIFQEDKTICTRCLYYERNKL